jgi:antitoxin HicB
MDIRYPAIITEGPEGGFRVQFTDLPEAFTEGETLEEALAQAAEVLTLTLEGRLDEGMDIPMPSEVSGAHYVVPEVRTQGVLLLRIARGEKSLAELARTLNTSWPQVKRMENPQHWPNLKTLDRAARAMGKRLVLEHFNF